jgi:hypothetical protein
LIRGQRLKSILNGAICFAPKVSWTTLLKDTARWRSWIQNLSSPINWGDTLKQQGKQEAGEKMLRKASEFDPTIHRNR